MTDTDTSTGKLDADWINEIVVFDEKQKSKKTPVRLLLSKNLDSEKKLSTKKITNLYLQRWGVENSFKQIKSTLNIEDIRVMKFRKSPTNFSMYLGEKRGEALKKLCKFTHLIFY